MQSKCLEESVLARKCLEQADREMDLTAGIRRATGMDKTRVSECQQVLRRYKEC